jgi:hypothetical protein
MEDNSKNKKISKMSVNQICNHFKISGYYRNFVIKKYKKETKSNKDWKKCLEEDGLKDLLDKS